MKLKLDENLDARLAAVLRRSGHEVATVRDQGLAGIVFRGPDDLLPTLRILTETLIGALAQASPAGQLWIIEPGRVRVHESPAEP